MHDEMIVKNEGRKATVVTHREIRPGKLYQHFKGTIYRVLNIGRHTETDEILVVYESVEHPGNVWCRPYRMFASEVDREKYPNVDPRIVYRFTELPDDLRQ